MSSSGGIGPDGKVYCKHIEEAAKRRSNTSRHPNREFYCCGRGPSDPTKCSFWYWADVMLPRLRDNVVHAPSSPAAQLPAPRPFMEGGSRALPTATPPARPAQKPSNEPSETPQSKKRLEDIAAGLKQRELDLGFTRLTGLPTPSKEGGPSTSPSSVHAIPQTPSPVPTEVGCDDETQPHKTFSFLGLHYSPEPVASTIQQEGQPSTPKKRRLIPPAEGTSTAMQPTADGVPFGDGLPLTPPQTTQRAAHSDGHEAVSARVRSRKGKEREDVSPATPDQDGYSWERQEEDALPLFTLPEDISSTSSVSPTIAENVLDYSDGIKTRMKVLSEYMESFDIAQAARMLQTIERQKIQYECRDRSQKKRIEELVAEKDQLAAEVSRLKEALKRSEESNRVKDAARWYGGD